MDWLQPNPFRESNASVRLKWSKDHTEDRYSSQGFSAAGNQAYSLQRNGNRWNVYLGDNFIGEVVNLKEAKDLARQHYRINLA